MSTSERKRRTKKEVGLAADSPRQPTWGAGLFERLTESGAPQTYEFIYPGTYPLRRSTRIFESDPYVTYGWTDFAHPMAVRTPIESPSYGVRVIGSPQIIRPEREKLLAATVPSLELADRVNLLLDLVGETHVVDALRPLETTTARETWLFRFVEERPASVREYVAFLTALNGVYELFLTVLRVEYFVNVWVKSKPIDISAADELRVISVTKNSPENLKVEGLAAGLKAVGEALSIGDQLQKIRTAGVKVDEAKLELRKKELELVEAERQAKIRASGTDVEALLEVEKKHAELDALRLKSEEDELKLKKMKLEYFREAFDTLGNTLQLLDRMPPSLKASFEELLQQKIGELLVEPPYRIEAAQRAAISDGK